MRDCMFRIMVVEDEEKIREELKNLLERYGYQVQALNDFHEAAGQIIAARPHLVLLDINLPEYDGYVLCRQIRQQ